MGPTTDDSICPDQTPLGEFNNNIAHSQLKFGLRILKHAPVVNPCEKVINSKAANMFSDN